MLHVSLSNHWPPPVLQVTGQKVQRGIWTTLRPPPTTTAALLPAPGRASAWKHASAFWTCAARVPTTPKTQTVVPRRRRPGRLWSWSNESTEQKADLMEGFWLRLDSSWPKLSDKLFWAVYTYLPQLHSMSKLHGQKRDFECHSWCMCSVHLGSVVTPISLMKDTAPSDSHEI